MISFLTALLTMAILSLPGWILALRGQASLGLAAAAGVGSIFTILLVSALIGELVGPLPAWSILVVGTLMAFAVLLITFGIALQDGSYVAQRENATGLLTGHLQVVHPERVDSGRFEHLLDDVVNDAVDDVVAVGTPLDAPVADGG